MCSQILSGGRTSQTGNTSETEIVPGGIHSNIERPAMCVQAPSSAASWTMTAIVAALASATPPYIQTSDRKYLHEILKCVTFSFKNINKWTESFSWKNILKLTHLFSFHHCQGISKSNTWGYIWMRYFWISEFLKMFLKSVDWMFVYVKPKLRVRNQLLRIIFQINARENLSEKKHVKNL